ncbi:MULTISPECIES: hypothetical protein [unclassified Microcoleus]|nr:MULTISPECIES: hypothetical protein [unclassified Microcoleus]
MKLQVSVDVTLKLSTVNCQLSTVSPDPARLTNNINCDSVVG